MEQRSRVPIWAALPLSAAGGLLLRLAFPDPGWWPLAFPGIAAILLALRHRGPWTGALSGAIAGAAFYGPLIFWATVYLGPIPWLGLTGAMVLYFGASGLLIAMTCRLADRVLGPAARLAILPLLVAGLWVLREYIAGSFPYGGFSWGRVAEAMADAPFAKLVAWVGMAGLSLLLVWLTALLVEGALLRGAASRLLGAARAAAPAALLLALLLIPAWQPTITGTLRVGGVQGNADAALNTTAARGTILQNHLDATRELMGERLDLLVWPENASDLDPLRVPAAAEALDAVTAVFGVPLVTGAITKAGDEYYNSALLWRSGQRAVDQYDKMHLVPFGEYLPDRWLYSLLVPELTALITRDYSSGTRDQLFSLPGGDGTRGIGVTAGVAICYDIVDDDLMIGMVQAGAELILAPTNNADFGRTDQHAQQFAIARLRAIETGRSVVHVSTVATSGIIAPDGSVLKRLPVFEPGVLLADAPIVTGTTPAVVLGRGVEWASAAVGVLGLLVLLIAERRRRGPQAPIFSWPRRERR